MGGSDLYALSLHVLLFSRSVDETFCYCKTMGLGLWMDNSSSPPNAHPFAVFSDFVCTEHKNI